ncbi:hypothetical protein BC628DRAFT_43441 [Trametes gibbosa]|nr:hypothetical protein BC628DRAFT_1414433 [Trametes gibbosa]KAI0833701.1 hypothetical protein BC628DRAFT_43441 [Trametes gibbosa]
MDPAAPIFPSHTRPLSALYDSGGDPLAHPYTYGADSATSMDGEWLAVPQDGVQPPYTSEVHFDPELSNNYLAFSHSPDAIRDGVRFDEPRLPSSHGTTAYTSPSQDVLMDDPLAQWDSPPANHGWLPGEFHYDAMSGPLTEPMRMFHKMFQDHAPSYVAPSETVNRSGYSALSDALSYAECATSSLAPSQPLPPFPSHGSHTMAQPPTVIVLPQPEEHAAPVTTLPRRRSKRATSSESELCCPPSPTSSSDMPERSLRTRKPNSLSLRRNAPVYPAAAPLPSLAPLPSPSSNAEDRWRCPHCPYVQRNRRGPELRRHIKTHTLPAEAGKWLWICCGVPLAEAAALGLPEDVRGEQPLEYNGMLFVGGCGKGMSRRDALGRHLRQRPSCFGTEYAWYLLGNSLGVGAG